MEEVNVRLECLKLAHRHDRTPEQVIVNAKEYEAYISNLKSDKPEGPPLKTGQDPKGKK